MNFRYKLMQFMSGRYGPDELFAGLAGIAIILSIINIFVRSLIIQILVYAFIIFAIYRTMSRQLEKRRRENAWFSEKIRFITRKKELYNKKKADKCHVYKKCPSCKAILRLPRRIGVHKTCCPKCGNEFTVKVKK